mmetsp:Transcript_71136/g.166539  ORF Transcript_71136/g.166539 Transcript_71136/m.166539 type:complete len:169 (+) Transcript_71136:78-584(+)
MTFAMSLAINAVQEQASREAQDAAMSERWVRSQVASIKSTCVAASKRCEYSAEIVTDGLPSLHQQEGQKKLLKELQTRLGQLGFTKLRVSQESSGEDAGKVRVSVSWAGLESKSQCFEFVRALPTLLTKGVLESAKSQKRLTDVLKLPVKPQNVQRSCRSWGTPEISC